MSMLQNVLRVSNLKPKFEFYMLTWILFMTFLNSTLKASFINSPATKNIYEQLHNTPNLQRTPLLILF